MPDTIFWIIILIILIVFFFRYFQVTRRDAIQPEENEPNNRIVSESVIGKYTPFFVPGSETFSADGKRIAYIDRLDGKQFIVLDAERNKPYDVVTGLTFSPDSKRLAYIVNCTLE